MATSKGAALDTVAEQRQAVIAKFAQMAEAIPTNESDTGILNILSQIESADGPQQLGAAWGSDAPEDLLGKVIKVTDLKRLPSDYATGLGFFLVVTAVDTQSGEFVTFTTGSVAVCAQLAKAYANQWLPLKCALRQSIRPTAGGYYPQHLDVYGVGDDF